ncbi:queuine tRNA-ribosyltransferase accessory subunit 2 [Scaptodrosophila lebanonensis]|uniref:Queuine tRNA-ribosyltransferase accessory subunit 2 n=1 Tax=Drosophila lebanonensis TaxID=7225 RepID=A0A6J2UA94_DROLE|nr:queuine tRNA-ribosyltransferase accessory subunit 2 [Scaptodrosophila lebanonensis]
MKFVINKQISRDSGRLGQLLIQRGEGAGQLQLRTPLLMQTTKGGSIPYLSGNVFEYVSKEQQPLLLQLTLSTMDQMAESLLQYPSGLSAYVGYPGYPNVLLFRDPCETTPSGGNDRDVVPLYTRHGKGSITAQRYMELMDSFAPDLYQGLCDADTNADSSKKRVQKSVDRTERFMDYCYEQHGKLDRLSKSTLLAPIVGGYSTYARTQSIKHARQQPANSFGGYVLEGFHTNGLSATHLEASKLLPIVKHCVTELDDEKPRMMCGAYTPLMILELVRLGVDMFDTSYAYCAAVNYKALTFNFELNDENGCPKQTPFLDITDDTLKEDFRPLVANCSCLACQKHTRAYVHHLYKTNELLGPILLMVHNLHHYMAFFETIHKSMASDKLSELAKLLNADSTADYSIAKNVKVINKAGMGKGFVSATN